MLLLSKLPHVWKGLDVAIYIVEHVGVLVAAEPLVLPVKSEGALILQMLLQCVFVNVYGINPSRLLTDLSFFKCISLPHFRDLSHNLLALLGLWVQSGLNRVKVGNVGCQ